MVQKIHRAIRVILKTDGREQSLRAAYIERVAPFMLIF